MVLLITQILCVVVHPVEHHHQRQHQAVLAEGPPTELLQLPRWLPEFTEVRVLQVEPQTAESDLQQDDVAALRADGGLPAPSEDVDQQGVQLQRVPSEVCLQQGSLPKLPCGCLEQEEVEIARQATSEDVEPYILATNA